MPGSHQPSIVRVDFSSWQLYLIMVMMDDPVYNAQVPWILRCGESYLLIFVMMRMCVNRRDDWQR